MPTAGAGVRSFVEVDPVDLAVLLARYGLQLERVVVGEPIPGSYWGDSEAGLLGDRLYVRADTPVHSLLHEACHYVCMTAERRTGLDTDAGGDFAEENAVCYLQIVLADQVPGFGRDRMLRDMDAWGYTFRLGSAVAWFTEDAADARRTLLDWGLLEPGGRPTFRCR
ncbi:MAG: hypothetical protein KGL36_13655 [Gammaproteobacteria bacterium]|nr:hypothetical protein [Gammaproteobacteria bacterium]